MSRTCPCVLLLSDRKPRPTLVVGPSRAGPIGAARCAVAYKRPCDLQTIIAGTPITPSISNLGHDFDPCVTRTFVEAGDFGTGKRMKIPGGRNAYQQPPGYWRNWRSCHQVASQSSDRECANNHPGRLRRAPSRGIARRIRRRIEARARVEQAFPSFASRARNALPRAINRPSPIRLFEA